MARLQIGSPTDLVLSITDFSFSEQRNPFTFSRDTELYLCGIARIEQSDSTFMHSFVRTLCQRYPVLFIDDAGKVALQGNYLVTVDTPSSRISWSSGKNLRLRIFFRE